VGNAVRFNGTNWVKAQADAAANADVDGLVSAVASANAFTVSLGGDVTGLSGLTAGQDYFLDPTTAGALTTTEPSTAGQVSVPVVKALSTTESIFRPQRGLVIPAKATVTLLVKLKDDATAYTVANDVYDHIVTSDINGYTLTSVIHTVTTVSSSGLPTLELKKGATAMLSTLCTIDASELTSETAATPAVIAGAGAATVATGDLIHFNITVAGTGAKGGAAKLVFTAP
jgi:hypothetical protein